jgi:hypothetical protein
MAPNIKTSFSFERAARSGGFRMDDYWVWCGSCARDDNGRYHLFASRWPKAYPMHPGRVFHSEVVRAEADRPEGPYTFKEVVLPRRDSGYFDGMATHNPSIHRHGDTWLLFYTGITYPMPPPEPDGFPRDGDPIYALTWGMKRIGLATAPSPLGPWTRHDEPVLKPRSGHWDNGITSNPAPCVLPDGSVYLLYKSCHRRGFSGGPFGIGMAKADHWDAPFLRLSDEPVFLFPSGHVEDPFLWHQDGRFHCIAKDMTGELCGEAHAGAHLGSDDGKAWELVGKAYSRNLTWDDGIQEHMGSLERPFLLQENGRPTHLFAATGSGPGGFHRCATTWNVVVPVTFNTSL